MAQINQVAQTINNKQLSPLGKLKDVLERVDVKDKLESILKEKKPQFVASLLSLYNATPQLQACEPMSIVSSAIIAATLDLPINPQLGYAAIVPYGNQATFQIMWRGFVQLAQRTGLYKTMEQTTVYEGELIEYNRVTGETKIDEMKRKPDAKVIGYVFYFRLITGFEKYVYMTTDQVTKHAKKFSKSFGKPGSGWTTNFDAMALKTVTKIGLGKWGPMSVDIQMQKAVQFDQSVVGGTLDNPIPNYIDAEMANDAIEPAAPSELINEKEPPK